MISHAELLKFKRWNSCSIANGLEQVSDVDQISIVNLDETRDFMPEMGPMVGFATTVVVSCNDPKAREKNPDNFARYLEYLASLSGPKIVVAEDVDKPHCFGSLWGEVSANMAKAFGCVGTIVDGAIRDVDEMKNAGFKALARRLVVSHGHLWPLRWDCEVKVFGAAVRPRQLIHADKHGFIIIPDEAQERLLHAVRGMDDLECETIIPALRGHAGKSTHEIVAGIQSATRQFNDSLKSRFNKKGEW